MKNQIEAELVDSLFDGASDDQWVGSAHKVEDIPDYLRGEYVPATLNGKRMLFGFHQHFIYGGDLDVYSYTNMLLQTADGKTYLPALNHRFLGVTLIDDEKHELVAQSVKCAAGWLLSLGGNNQFPSIAGQAVQNFYLAHPDIKQYFFFGDEMAKAVTQSQPWLKTDSNSKHTLTMLSGLTPPCYGFEIGERSA